MVSKNKRKSIGRVAETVAQYLDQMEDIVVVYKDKDTQRMNVFHTCEDRTELIPYADFLEKTACLPVKGTVN